MISKHKLLVLSALLVLCSVRLASAAGVLDKAFTPENLAKYRLEFLGLVLIAVYIAAAVVGTKKNYQIATGWLRALSAPDGALARNFAVYGLSSADGPQLWWKESASEYKCYASGRRYTVGALLTLRLKARQDIFSQLWYLLSPKEDTMVLDVFMTEASMPQTVLMVGQPKLVKAMTRDEPLIGNFAKVMQVSKERVPGGWANERMAVAAEHPALFYELLNTEPALAKGLSGRLLRCALLSSEVMPEATPAVPKLSFVFGLPSTMEQADELNTMMSCAFMLVDLLGSYKVPPDMKKRSQELRQRLQQEEAKKGSADRLEVLQQKRAEKLEAERAKARAAGPAALAKFEEKMQSKMRQKEMRKRMIRA